MKLDHIQDNRRRSYKCHLSPSRRLPEPSLEGSSRGAFMLLQVRFSCGDVTFVFPSKRTSFFCQYHTSGLFDVQGQQKISFMADDNTQNFKISFIKKRLTFFVSFFAIIITVAIYGLFCCVVFSPPLTTVRAGSFSRTLTKMLWSEMVKPWVILWVPWLAPASGKL